MRQSKVTKRTDYIAPTPPGAYNFKSSHAFTPPDSLVQKAARPRSGLLRPATKAERAEELVTLLYSAPPRPARPPVAAPAATLPSTPTDPCDSPAVQASTEGCQDPVPGTPAGQEALLMDLLQSQTQGTAEPHMDAGGATPAVLQNLLCTATSANFTAASDSAYQRLLCPTVGRSSVLKLSIDSFAVEQPILEGGMPLRQSVASEAEIDVHTENVALCADDHAEQAQLAADSNVAHSQQSETHTAPPSRLPKRTVTPKPSAVLASTPGSVQCSESSDIPPASQAVLNVESEEHAPPHAHPAIPAEQVTPSDPSESHTSTPGSWLLQPGSDASVGVHESIESMILPELSNAQWQAQVPGSHASGAVPSSQYFASRSTTVPGVQTSAESGQLAQSSSWQEVGVAATPPPCSLRLDVNRVLQVQSAVQDQNLTDLETPRKEASAPGRLAMPAFLADTDSDVARSISMLPLQLPEARPEGQRHDEVGQMYAPEPFPEASSSLEEERFSISIGDKQPAITEGSTNSISVPDSTGHALLRRSITDIVTHIGVDEDKLQQCLRNSISDASPIDLNPQHSFHSLAPQMPLFTSPVPQNQREYVPPASRQQKIEANNRQPAASGIPVRAPAASCAPDSPCSRSLKKSVTESRASHIPNPTVYSVHPHATQGSPRCPPAPRLPLARSALSPSSPRPVHAPPPFSPDAVNFKRGRSVTSSPFTPNSSQPSSKRAAQGRHAASPVLSPGVLSRPHELSPPTSFGSAEASSAISSPVARLRTLVPSSPSPQGSPRVPSRHFPTLNLPWKGGSPSINQEVCPILHAQLVYALHCKSMACAVS